MASLDNLDFSFSGLKTAVARHVREHGVPGTEQGVADLCASFQRVVVDSLVRKSLAACVTRGVSDLVITGGVAANRGLRAGASAAADEAGIRVHVPPFASCTDNAAMIAYAGITRLRAGRRDGLDLRAFSRDPDYRRGRIRREPRS
jgi:N6-L-threonylcarbamoyladenine synthase